MLPLPVQRISHGGLESTDLPRTRRFYEEFLGLRCVYHLPRAMMVQSEGRWSIFVVWVAKRIESLPLLNHFGLDVPSVDAVDRARELALSCQQAYGIRKVTPCKRQHGSYSFYLEDVDGNWWEIQHDEAKFCDVALAHGDVTSDASLRPPPGS